MKTILILTDFTENATHAALSGVMLSENLHANILLFNANTSQPVIPQYAGGGPTVIDDLSYWEDESKERLGELSEHLMAMSNPQKRKPSIHVQCGEGSMGDIIKHILHQKDIELIVMGARAGSTIEHILTGSETISVINHSTRPVLVVPLNAGLKKLKKVIFATDFEEADVKGIHYLVKLGKLFNYRLDIVHVSLLGEKNTLDSEKEEAFLSQLAGLKYGIRYKEIEGEEVISTLNSLCDETGTDLLALGHHQRSLFTSLFRQSTTKKALLSQKTPLLVFPSKMEGD